MGIAFLFLAGISTCLTVTEFRAQFLVKGVCKSSLSNAICLSLMVLRPSFSDDLESVI